MGKYEREIAICYTGLTIRIFLDLAQEVAAKNIDEAIFCGAGVIIIFAPCGTGSLGARFRPVA